MRSSTAVVSSDIFNMDALRLAPVRFEHWRACAHGTVDLAIVAPSEGNRLSSDCSKAAMRRVGPALHRVAGLSVARVECINTSSQLAAELRADTRTVLFTANAR
eukprot:1756558-Prymnesium_polylepis.2